MRIRSLDQVPIAQIDSARSLPPGTGVFIAAAVSAVMWCLIAGLAAIV